MKNKIVKKSVAIIMLLSIFLSLISNIVLAKSIGDEAYLENKGDCGYHLQYWNESRGVWSYIICTYVTYNENGTEYPAYCLDKELHGVGEESNYSVDLTQMLDDVRVWRTIINGYPYKSPEELGVENQYDAFVATKQAVYCVLYDWDAVSRYRGGDDRGTKIANAIVNMVNAGRYGSETPYTAGVSVNKIGDLYEDGDYYTQELSLNCGASTRNYTLTSVAGLPNGSKITNMNNNETTYFEGTSHFKVRIPKSSMNTDINVTIAAQASVKTYPVFYGKTRIEGTQNYAITCDPYGDITGYGTFNLKTNTGKLQVNKTDDETKEPISNVTFQLAKKDGTIIANSTTNENGIATFENLYQGNYVLKEISTNQNYVLNSADFEVNIEYNKTTTKNIENEHKKGNLKIYKVDKENNKVVLENVKFDLFSNELNKVIGTYTTDVNGEIYIENLRTGNYRVIEKNTNKWYNLADDVNIEIKWNETNEITIENELKKGQIKVIKVDKDNKEIKLQGVKFNVLNENRDVLETITTDKDGIAYTSRYVVRDFQKLILQETETLKNYVLNNELQTIELKENEITNIVFDNKKISGNVELTKTDVEHKEKISNCTFKIYKDSNMNGRLDGDDEYVDTLEETEKGIYEKQNLEYGKYFISETKAEDGYVISKETEFDIIEDEITINIELIDKIVDMSKVDIDGQEIEGATIQVIDKDNKVIDEWVSEKEPHKIKNLVEGETYTLHEEVAVDEYVKATDIEFEVSYEKQNQHLELIDKVVEIVKTDLVTGDEIEGAELQVIDEDGNIIDEWISGKEAHKVTGLEENKKYILIEKTPPYGYERTEEIEFVVTTDKETQLVEMKDMPILKNIKLNKIDSKTKEIIKEKFAFGIYEDEKCNNLIKEIKSNKEDGYIIFEDLRYGTYYIKETKAPAGYELSNKILSVEINDNGVFVDGNLIKESYSINFENDIIEVPNTGDNRYTEIFAIISGFSAILLVGTIIYNYKKKNNKKKK